MLDAIFTVRRGRRPGRRRAHRKLWPVAVRLADRAAESGEPSNGIWEIREQQDFVSGDIGRWLALDRALRLGHRITAARTRGRWRRARNEARDKVLGAIEPDGSLPQVYGKSGADASALLLVAFDLLSPRDPRGHSDSSMPPSRRSAPAPCSTAIHPMVATASHPERRRSSLRRGGR